MSALPLRVRVTGFHDWKELGEPADPWRCRDNPSGRLLVGVCRGQRPESPRGPLPRWLSAHGTDIAQWSFESLPVTWAAVRDDHPDHADVVIHLGLGVYDRHDQILMEHGAYNFAQGADAVGELADGPVESAGPRVMSSTPGARAVIAALDGRRVAGLELRRVDARPDNVFLCNRTHYASLASAHVATPPRDVLFLHLPHPAPQPPGRPRAQVDPTASDRHFAAALGQVLVAVVAGVRDHRRRSSGPPKA